MLDVLYDIILKTGVIFIPLFIVGLIGWFLVLEVFYFLWQIRGEKPNKYKEINKSKINSYLNSLLTIKVLAQSAPLLGLLGTVHGMINTFKIISYYGNGNAILMADSISEALLTTQAGLIIAFPLLFVNVLLSSKLKRIIPKDDEKN